MESGGRDELDFQEQRQVGREHDREGGDQPLARAVGRFAELQKLAAEPRQGVVGDVEGLDGDVVDFADEVVEMPDHRGNTTMRASAPM